MCRFLCLPQRSVGLLEAQVTKASMQGSAAECLSSDVRNTEMFFLLDMFDTICKITGILAIIASLPLSGKTISQSILYS